MTRPLPPHPAPQRLRCARCQRPQRGCLCRWIVPTDNQVALLILQHPLEQHQAKGSARLLQLSLQRCRCEVGEVFDPATLAAWLAEAPTLLLYPAVPQQAAAPPLPLPEPAGTRLLLLDGTWRKTRKLLHANPALAALPRWPLPAPPPSRYAIRRAHGPGQLSTLEAACLALGALEGRPVHYAPLLSAFDGWVADGLAWRTGAADVTAGTPAR